LLSPSLTRLRLSLPLAYDVYMEDDSLVHLIMFFDGIHTLGQGSCLEVGLSQEYFQYNSIARMEAAMRTQGYQWSMVGAAGDVTIKVFK